MQKMSIAKKQISALLATILCLVPLPSIAKLGKVNIEQARLVVARFLSLTEEKKQSKKRQEICSYVIKEACNSTVDPEQSEVSEIFLDALKALAENNKPLTKEEKQFFTRYSGKNLSELYNVVDIPVLSINNLEKLSEYIPFARVITGLEINQVEEDNDLSLLKQLPRLAKLNLLASQIPVERIKDILEACPNLISLTLRWCNNLTDSELQFIARNCPKLTQLELNLCSQITNDGIKELSNLSNLNTLWISHNEQLTDEVIPTIVEKLPNLTKLGLYGCEQITNNALVGLIQLRNLNYLAPPKDRTLDGRETIRAFLISKS